MQTQPIIVPGSATPILDYNREIFLRAAGVLTVNSRGLLQASASDVKIESFTVLDERRIGTDFKSTDNNAYACLVLEHFVRLKGLPGRTSALPLDRELKAFFPICFGENWWDRFTANEDRGRPLLKALDYGTLVEDIVWKP